MRELLLRAIRLQRHNLLPYFGQRELTGSAQVLAIEEIRCSGIFGGGGWGEHASPYSYIGTRVTCKVEHLYVGSLTIDGTCTALVPGDIVRVSFKRHCNEEIKKVLITTQHAKEQ